MIDFRMTLLLTFLINVCPTEVYYQIISKPNQIIDYPLYEKVTNTSTPIFKKLDAWCTTRDRIKFSAFKHPWYDYYLLLWSERKKSKVTSGVKIVQSYWEIVSDTNGTRTECEGLFYNIHINMYHNKYYDDEVVTSRVWDKRGKTTIQRIYYSENDKKENVVWTIHNLLASEKQLNHNLARALQENQEISQKLNATVIQKDTQIMYLNKRVVVYLNKSRNVNKISCANTNLNKKLNETVIDKDKQINIATHHIIALNKSNDKISQAFHKLHAKFIASTFKENKIKNALQFERKCFAFVIVIMGIVCIVSNCVSYLCFKRRINLLQEMQRLLVGRNKVSIVNQHRDRQIIVNNNNKKIEEGGRGNVRRYWQPEQFNNMLINASGVQNAVIDDILSDMATEEGFNQKQRSSNNLEEDILDGTPVTR